MSPSRGADDAVTPRLDSRSGLSALSASPETLHATLEDPTTARANGKRPRPFSIEPGSTTTAHAGSARPLLVEASAEWPYGSTDDSDGGPASYATVPPMLGQTRRSATSPAFSIASFGRRRTGDTAAETRLESDEDDTSTDEEDVDRSLRASWHSLSRPTSASHSRRPTPMAMGSTTSVPRKRARALSHPHQTAALAARHATPIASHRPSIGPGHPSRSESASSPLILTVPIEESPTSSRPDSPKRSLSRRRSQDAAERRSARTSSSPHLSRSHRPGSSGRHASRHGLDEPPPLPQPSRAPRPMSELLLPQSNTFASGLNLGFDSFALPPAPTPGEHEPSLRELLSTVDLQKAIDLVHSVQEAPAPVPAPIEATRNRRSTTVSFSSAGPPSSLGDHPSLRPLLSHHDDGRSMSPERMAAPAERGDSAKKNGRRLSNALSIFGSGKKDRGPTSPLSSTAPSSAPRTRTRTDTLSSGQRSLDAGDFDRSLRSPEARAFDEAIARVQLQLSAQTVKRAEACRTYISLRYAAIYDALNDLPPRAPPSLIAVSDWRRRRQEQERARARMSIGVRHAPILPKKPGCQHRIRVPGRFEVYPDQVREYVDSDGRILDEHDDDDLGDLPGTSPYRQHSLSLTRSRQSDPHSGPPSVHGVDAASPSPPPPESPRPGPTKRHSFTSRMRGFTPMGDATSPLMSGSPGMRSRASVEDARSPDVSDNERGVASSLRSFPRHAPSVGGAASLRSSRFVARSRPRTGAETDGYRTTDVEDAATSGPAARRRMRGPSHEPGSPRSLLASLRQYSVQPPDTDHEGGGPSPPPRSVSPEPVVLPTVDISREEEAAIDNLLEPMTGLENDDPLAQHVGLMFDYLDRIETFEAEAIFAAANAGHMPSRAKSKSALAQLDPSTRSALVTLRSQHYRSPPLRYASNLPVPIPEDAALDSVSGGSANESELDEAYPDLVRHEHGGAARPRSGSIGGYSAPRSPQRSSTLPTQSTSTAHSSPRSRRMTVSNRPSPARAAINHTEALGRTLDELDHKVTSVHGRIESEMALLRPLRDDVQSFRGQIDGLLADAKSLSVDTVREIYAQCERLAPAQSSYSVSRSFALRMLETVLNLIFWSIALGDRFARTFASILSCSSSPSPLFLVVGWVLVATGLVTSLLHVGQLASAVRASTDPPSSL